MPRRLRCLLLLPALLLPACAAVPGPGERLYAEVEETVRAASVARSFPWLRNALAQGVTAEEVAEGRLGTVTCAAVAAGGFREVSYPVRVPPALADAAGAEVLFRPGVERGTAGPIGEVVRRAPGPELPMVDLPRAGGAPLRMPRCDGAGAAGLLGGRLDTPASAAMLQWVRQEDAWLAALPAGPLAEGRIVTLICAPGTRETRRFYAEVLSGQVLARGDHVEAVAGVPNSGWPGPIARFVRRMDRPPSASLVEYRPGRFMIACVPR